MIGWNRLRHEYVEGSGRDMALAKSVGEGRGIDQIAPGDVDQDHARPHPVDGVTIDHTPRPRGRRAMQRDHVGILETGRLSRFAATGLDLGRLDRGIVHEYAALECANRAATSRPIRPNPTTPIVRCRKAQTIRSSGVASPVSPAAGAEPVGHDLSVGCQDERESVIGHLVNAVIGQITNWNSPHCALRPGRRYRRRCHTARSRRGRIMAAMKTALTGANWVMTASASATRHNQ